MKFEREKKVGLRAVADAARFCIKVRQAIPGQVSVMKGDKTPATVADFGCQAIIAKTLSASFPNVKIMAEEQSDCLLENMDSSLPDLLKGSLNDFLGSSAEIKDICQWIDAGSSGAGDIYWTVDPIDGTKGFLRGGQYAVALALIANGAVEIGFLGCPNLQYDQGRKGCLFMSARGCGTTQIWLEDANISKRIKVSSGRGKGALRFVESVEAEHANQDLHMEISKKLGIEEPPLRMDSQAKYAVIGRAEASVYLRLPSISHPDYQQKVWDHAAGFIIVEEAGGRVTDSLGIELDFSLGSTLKNNKGIVATNGACHDAVIKCIEDIASRRNKIVERL